MSECPDNNWLLGYAMGTLPLDLVATIEHHVFQCSRCADSLDGVAGTPDDFLKLLHESASAKPVSAILEPEFLPAIELIRRHAFQSSVDTD